MRTPTCQTKACTSLGLTGYYRRFSLDYETVVKRLNRLTANCVMRRDLLVVTLAVKHLRPYLYGREFDLRANHASLIWLYKSKEPAHQIARWPEMLAESNFNIQH